MTHADNKMQVYGKSREAITTKKKIIVLQSHFGHLWLNSQEQQKANNLNCKPEGLK